MTAARDRYRNAFENLTSSLEQVWLACGETDGYNLPEALARALAVVATRVTHRSTDQLDALADEPEDTAEVLVCHRPSSWEAGYVRQLVIGYGPVEDRTD